MSRFCSKDDQKSVVSLTRYYSTHYSKPAHTGASGGLLYCVALSHTHVCSLLLNSGVIFPTLPRLQSARRHQPSVEPNEVGLNAKNESNLRKRSGGGHGYVFCKGSRAIGNAVGAARQGWKEIFFELCSLKAWFLFPSISWELQQQTPSGATCFVSASMLWQITAFVMWRGKKKWSSLKYSKTPMQTRGSTAACTVGSAGRSSYTWLSQSVQFIFIYNACHNQDCL